ncbi:MAG: hypothetical protein U0M53_08120, partial [Oscillospiraceae bacterium]|nr:hypothetical protein [Oscillospiraceae bacterium]
MKFFIFDTQEEGGACAARRICQLVSEKPDAMLCLAAGHSSLPVFSALVAASKEGEADFSKARFVGMDEWLGVPPENEGSCANFLRRSLFGPLGVSEDQICLFDAMTSEPER